MKKKILLVFKIVLSVIIIIYLLRTIPLPSIISSLRSADPFMVVTGLLLIFLISYLSAFETRFLTRVQDLDLTVLDIFKILLSTNFYGLFLPGSLSGGAVKWYKFSQHGKRSSAAVVVVFNRFLEILIISFLGIFFSIVSILSHNNINMKIMLIWGILFLILLFLYFIFINKYALFFFKKIVSKLPVPFILKRKILELIIAMHRFRKLGFQDHFKIITLMLIYHAVGVLSFYYLARSLNIEVSIWIIGWIRSAIEIMTMIPISFAGLGVREGTFVFLLNQYGILPDLSLALSLLIFFRFLLSALSGGIMEFLSAFQSTGKNLRRESFEK
jgi:uncharacterized protein (TIRG00374 family)